MSYEFDCPACRRSFSPSGSGYESRLTSSNPSASALKKKRRHKYPKKFFPNRFNRLSLKIAWIHKREFYSSSGEPMSTQAQIAANQKNSQNSTGPKSETGKAVSCRNNFRHGFTGAFQVLGWENAGEFDQLTQQLTDEHQPATPTERLLVIQMAQGWWLRTRALLLQNECFMADSVDQKQLALYLRYQTTHERGFHKALNELLKLRAEKRKSEIGFESQERKQAEEARRQAVEKRRQELHKWNVLRAEAEVDHRVLLNLNLQTSEHSVSVGPERIIAAQKAA